MAVVSMKQLLEAGVHFGHQTRRWNPKMAPYIYTERNGIYIIDLQKTVKKLEEAYNFVRELAANGQSILFVGTKKQAQDAIKEEAERVGQYYVNARWLGGMLTNFRTMRTRIDRLAQLKKMEADGTFAMLPKKEVIKHQGEIAKLEKYLVEDLMGAKIAHSYGDMFFSPMKRLIMLSALKQLHGKDIVGSMVFTNKLGRNHKDISLNVPHLSMSLIYDMAGQYVYQTGHAVTTMANQGLTTDTTVEDVVKTLEYAKELEAYLPAVVDTIDFDKIDREAAKVCKRGEMFFEATLEALSQVIDVRNPYALLSALKRVGIKNLTAAFGKDDSDVIVTDYNLFSHEY